MKDTDLEWKELDAMNPEARPKTLFLVEQFIQDHPEAVMDHDPEWLYAKCGIDKFVKIFVCFASDGALIGYAPFFVHPSALSFELFGLSLFDYRIRRYCITAYPLIAMDCSKPHVLLEDLFVKISRSLGQRDVVFGLGVQLASNFGQLLGNNAELRKKYQVLPYGSSYQRRLIVLPTDFEIYLKELGYSTRYEIRRAQRLLEKNAEAAVSFRIFSRPDEVSELLSLLEQVSVKTYQHNLLNLGINNNAEIRHIFDFAARKGWLRSLILFCQGNPVAFQHGFLYNDSFYLTHMGYDPAWAKWSVGTVAHAYFIRELIESGVKKFDFLYGDNGSKARLSNLSREEQNFYLVPRTFPLSAVAFSLRAFNSMVDSIGKFIEKYGIKTRIRKLLRQHATTNK